jgi:hypothetical protein
MAPHRAPVAVGPDAQHLGWPHLIRLNLVWGSKFSGGTAVSGMDTLGLNVDSAGWYV